MSFPFIRLMTEKHAYPVMDGLMDAQNRDGTNMREQATQV